MAEQDNVVVLPNESTSVRLILEYPTKEAFAALVARVTKLEEDAK